MFINLLNSDCLKESTKPDNRNLYFIKSMLVQIGCSDIMASSICLTRLLIDDNDKEDNEGKEDKELQKNRNNKLEELKIYENSAENSLLIENISKFRELSKCSKHLDIRFGREKIKVTSKNIIKPVFVRHCVTKLISLSIRSRMDNDCTRKHNLPLSS
ncbi:hypothetical protein Glove_396g77 [Diversispora epigaea]|uniref:Uncharacterized protein n=1 Tax=Diversispora epigaea TaxID=1348612 RepID=A0A397H138_9GLOM|nr:hypothetical protein Glove_396g77 [Diversispora epigaea]